MSPRAKRLGPAIVCCRDWMELPATKRDRWAWQVIHQLAHSRVTFSVRTFADLAKVPDKEAEEMVQEARRWKWVWVTAQGVWVGRLAKRK